MKMRFRIRASHLKNGAYGLICNGEPLQHEGLLIRFYSLRLAIAEGNRRAIVFGETCEAKALCDMAGVEIYGIGYVLASSGAN